VKRANRDAEAMTTSAEALAAVASLSGFKYPRAALRRNWEDITFHHHHDTLPGSGIHSPYEKTKTQLARVVAEDADIMQRAMEHMSLRVAPKPGGISVMVFNPLGWKRSGWVETYLVQSGWYGGERLDPMKAVAVDPSGREHQVVVLDERTRLARIWAADIPAFGYRVFHIRNGVPANTMVTLTNPTSPTVETDRFVADFANQPGPIVRLFD
jgi:alpha-mannosidase